MRKATISVWLIDRYIVIFSALFAGGVTMNLKQLRYFCAIVDAGSSALAAEHLFVASSAISMQLTLLEDHVGGELFDRSRRPMELTPLGKFLYPRAKEMLSQMSRLDEDARGLAGGRRGWLGIGFVRSTLFSILPRTVQRFRALYPEVQLDLVEMLTEYQPAQLRSGRIHIGLSRFAGAFDRSADLTFTHVLDDPLVVALPKDHPLARKNSLSAQDLESQSMIFYPKDSRGVFGQQLKNLLATANVRFTAAYEAIEIHTALALVGAGMGLTLVARSAMQNNRSDIVFRGVDDLHQDTTLMAITRQGEINSLADAFIDILLSEGVELPGDEAARPDVVA